MSYVRQAEDIKDELKILRTEFQQTNILLKSLIRIIRVGTRQPEDVLAGIQSEWLKKMKEDN
tara:strand:- start:396 stop:581 length:186 start_codon:yes stop_codon:yes gene_type:complete